MPSRCNNTATSWEVIDGPPSACNVCGVAPSVFTAVWIRSASRSCSRCSSRQPTHLRENTSSIRYRCSGVFCTLILTRVMSHDHTWFGPAAHS